MARHLTKSCCYLRTVVDWFMEGLILSKRRAMEGLYCFERQELKKTVEQGDFRRALSFWIQSLLACRKSTDVLKEHIASIPEDIPLQNHWLKNLISYEEVSVCSKSPNDSKTDIFPRYSLLCLTMYWQGPSVRLNSQRKGPVSCPKY
jgi:hypothetical protein